MYQKQKHDPANYRKLSEPFASIDTANDALKAFFDAVEAARNQFGITDVHVIVKFNVMDGKSEGAAMTTAHYGDILQSVPMCAWAFGQAQAGVDSIIRSYSKATAVIEHNTNSNQEPES